MTLRQYFQDKPRGAQAAMAAELGVSRTWMSLLVQERKSPSAALALMIERITNGKVTRKALRPDLFGEIK